MQIPPSIISGQNGFQSAQSDLTQATVDVAGSSQSASGTTMVSSGSTTEPLVDASQAGLHAQASAEVIHTSSDTLGTLINIKV